MRLSCQIWVRSRKRILCPARTKRKKKRTTKKTTKTQMTPTMRVAAGESVVAVAGEREAKMTPTRTTLNSVRSEDDHRALTHPWRPGSKLC